MKVHYQVELIYDSGTWKLTSVTKRSSNEKEFGENLIKDTKQMKDTAFIRLAMLRATYVIEDR